LVDGGYAEYVKIPARNAIPIPGKLDFNGAAAIPLVFLTAWHMLVRRAKIHRGDTVLIHSVEVVSVVRVFKLLNCLVHMLLQLPAMKRN